MKPASEIDSTIATCRHRLDQLTRPTFERNVVDALLAEIDKLRSVKDYANALEIQLTQIEEERDEAVDDNEALTKEVMRQGVQITDLTHRINQLITENNRRAMGIETVVDKEARNCIPMPHKPSGRVDSINPARIEDITKALDKIEKHRGPLTPQFAKALGKLGYDTPHSVRRALNGPGDDYVIGLSARKDGR